MNGTSYQVIDILNLMTDYLKKKGVENARLNAELLAGHILKLDRVQLYLNFERVLSSREVEQLRGLLLRRSQNEPLQYILGETEFFGLKFKVTPATLIPRPETEMLVERVIQLCQQKFPSQQTISLLDIGAGSGNIAIAVAKNVANSQIVALDKNLAALEVAEENAKFHQVADKIRFAAVDIFDKIDNSFPQFDGIVSNPPYVTETEFVSLPAEIRNFEPSSALDGGSDGTKFYRRIAELMPDILQPGGFVAVEIGVSLEKIVTDIFNSIHFFQKIEVVKDLTHRSRIVIGYGN